MPESSAVPVARRRWRGFRAALTSPAKVFVAALGSALVGLLLGYSLSVFVLFPGEEVPGGLVLVPNLTGLEREAARHMAEERGLSYVEADSFNHPSIAAGRVLAQDPLEGQWALAGASVWVTVSLGPVRRSLPSVEGLGYQVATLALREAGFKPVLSWVDAQAAVGEVVGTRPPAGTRLELPAEVTVLVSAGPERIMVPDLVSRSLAEARATLERLGLRLGRVVTDVASDAAPGTVLAQTPLAGTVASRGDSVSLAVAGRVERMESAEDSVANRLGNEDGVQ